MLYTGFDKNYSLNGKVTIITGACKGIGRAISELYVQKGAIVIMVDIDPNVEEVAKIIRKEYGPVDTFVADITNDSELNALVEKTEEKYGRINVLVNNAGIGPLEPAESMRTEIFDKTLEINLKAPFILSQLVAQIMISSGNGGKIINMASQAGVVAISGHTAYTTSKAGLIGLTKALAFEWGKYNINVNAISPTVTLTDLALGYWTGEIAEKALVQTPVGRFADPAEIAGLAVYLASDASNMVTGANFIIDGGYTIH